MGLGAERGELETAHAPGWLGWSAVPARPPPASTSQFARRNCSALHHCQTSIEEYKLDDGGVIFFFAERSSAYPMFCIVQTLKSL